jgi:AcrR family transcriptional regulator
MRVRAVPGSAEPSAATTRERLIEAAADVIAEAGYDRAGIQEIARRAGLTNGAIYANFRDKSELLAEAVECGLVKLFGRMEDPGQTAATAGAVVHEVGRTLPLNTPPRNRLLISEALAAARRDPEVGERVRQLLATLECEVSAVVDEARRDGELGDDVDPAALARFGVALSIGYHVTYAAGMTEPDPAAWVRLMTRVVGSLRA